jgi:hypothetical protein
MPSACETPESPATIKVGGGGPNRPKIAQDFQNRESTAAAVLRFIPISQAFATTANMAVIRQRLVMLVFRKAFPQQRLWMSKSLGTSLAFHPLNEPLSARSVRVWTSVAARFAADFRSFRIPQIDVRSLSVPTLAPLNR